jgi:ligand-binding sensor domain-containing protein
MKERTAALIIFLSLVSVIGIGAEEQALEEEELKRGGWVVSGTVVSFSALDGTSLRSPSGRLENLCPTRSVHDLQVVGDTLWIASESGLFAYCISEDSVAFMPGPVPGSADAIAFDDAGSLWVGGRNGLSIRSEAGWSHYTSEVDPFFSRVTDISIGEERVWLSTYGNGAGFVEKGNITMYSRRDSLLDDRVLRVLEQGSHTVWFGTASGLCRADTLRWQSMRYGSRLPIGAVKDILLDEEGNIFLSIAQRGVAVYNLGRVRAYGPGRGLPEHGVNAFSLDPLGKVWAAGTSGLSTFDGSGWIPYRLPGVAIGRYNFLSIHHGVEGECYLGTDEGLVVILSRDTVREIVLPQKFPESTISRLRISEGSVWGIGIDYIYRLGDTWRRIDLPGEHYRGALMDVSAGPGNELWIASRFGLLRFDGSSWEVFDRRQGLPTEHFTSVARDRRGHLWLGTYDRGVLRLAGDKWVHYSTGSGLSDDRIEDLIVDHDGDPWIATATGKIARFHDGQWQNLELPLDFTAAVARADSTRPIEPYITFLSSEQDGDALGTLSRALCLGLDGSGNCMVASSRGIFRFAGSDWQVISLPDGYGLIQPTAVLGTARGSIWLGTERKGVFIRNRRGWVRLGTVNGLCDECIESLCEDGGGDIWIGTRFGGLSRFSPDPTLRAH